MCFGNGKKMKIMTEIEGTCLHPRFHEKRRTLPSQNWGNRREKKEMKIGGPEVEKESQQLRSAKEVSRPCRGPTKKGGKGDIVVAVGEMFGG